jgi:hypothetical protein
LKIAAKARSSPSIARNARLSSEGEWVAAETARNPLVTAALPLSRCTHRWPSTQG